MDALGLNAPGSWTDLAARVRRFEVRRGREFELDRFEPGEATIVLANRDGALDPTNPAAAHPIKLFRPVRLQAHYGTGPSCVFTGFVDRAVQRRRGRRDAELELHCTDALGLFAESKVPANANLAHGPASGGDCWYAPQHVDDRIRAALADGNWPPALTRIRTGNVSLQGIVYAAGTPLLTVLQDAAEAEFPGVASLFADGNGTIRFNGRKARFQAESKAALGDAAWLAAHADAIPIKDDDFTLLDGVDHVVNDVTVYPYRVDPRTIPSLRAVDSASVTAYGRRARSFELAILAADNGNTAVEECARYARYLVQNYATPKPAVRKLVLSPPMSDTIRTFVQQLELGDLLTVHVANPGGGRIDENYFVEGILHAGDASESWQSWRTELDLSPQTLWLDLPTGLNGSFLTDTAWPRPQNLRPPAISGLAQVGQTLTADPGDWTY